MRFSVKALSYFIIAAMMMSFSSCGVDDEPGNGENGGNGGDNPDIDPKEFFEETATMFLNKFKAADQQAVIKMANDFVTDYGDLDMPGEFSMAPAASMMQSLARTLSSNDFAGLSRSYESYYYAFSKYTGIYKPGKYSWSRESDSSDIVFRFTDRSGKECSITAKASSETWTGNITIDGDTYKAEVPKTISIEVKQGSTTMLTATVETNYVKNSKLNVTTVTEAANLKVSAELAATNTTVKSTTTLAVNGEVITTGVAEINGQNLCMQDYIQSLIENEDEDGLFDLFTNANATADVLGRVQVKGSISQFRNVGDALDYDDTDKQGAIDAAKLLNEKLPCKFYFNGSSNARGSVEWQCYLSWESSWSDEKWWGVEPILLFNDGTSYAFEDYFGNGKFGSVESLFENLLDSYEALWK